MAKSLLWVYEDSQQQWLAEAKTFHANKCWPTFEKFTRNRNKIDLNSAIKTIYDIFLLKMNQFDQCLIYWASESTAIT